MIDDDDARTAALCQADYMLRAALDLLCACMPECIAHSIVDQVCEDHARQRLLSDETLPASSALTSRARH